MNQAIYTFFNFLFSPEGSYVIYGFLIAVTIVLLLLSYIIKKSKWDYGIKKHEQTSLQIHYPFDPSKGILYISRRMIGFWQSSDSIVRVSNFEENKDILKILARNYNLILYIPSLDQYGVLVSDLDPSYKFIIDNDLPICYITMRLPFRYKTKPFSCNDNKIWFIEYKKGDEINRWDGYM